MIAACAPARPSSMVRNGTTPRLATAGGSRVRGATTRISPAPRARRAWISERATRECRMSPTIATRMREKSGKRWRSVNMSSIAWVGCAWLPSPALMTLTCSAACRTTKCAAPLS